MMNEEEFIRGVYRKYEEAKKNNMKGYESIEETNKQNSKLYFNTLNNIQFCFYIIRC